MANTYKVYQKYASIRFFRNNIPLEKPVFMAIVEAKFGVDALVQVAKELEVPSLLLKAEKE